MRWTGFLFFVTLQREIPFGKARSVNSRETYADIVNALSEIHESWRRKDEIQDANNKTRTNSDISERKSENKVPLEVTLKGTDAHVDDKHIRSHDRREIKLEDIQWKQSKFRGTDLILSIPFLPTLPPVNELNHLRTKEDNIINEGHNGQLVCGFSLRNKFWIANETALTSITDGQKSPVIQLPFSYFDGVCKTFGYDKNDKTWMCFARQGTNLCQSFDGLNFVPEAETSYNHSCTNSLGSYNETPFITGSSRNVKTEIFDPKSDSWTLSVDFPFASKSISFYDTISLPGSMYLIGGLSDGIASDIIAQFKNDQWTIAGELLKARYGHRSIKIGEDILVFGGFNPTKPPNSKEKKALSEMPTAAEFWSLSLSGDFSKGYSTNVTLSNNALTNGLFVSLK